MEQSQRCTELFCLYQISPKSSSYKRVTTTGATSYRVNKHEAWFPLLYQNSSQ